MIHTNVLGQNSRTFKYFWKIFQDHLLTQVFQITLKTDFDLNIQDFLLVLKAWSTTSTFSPIPCYLKLGMKAGKTANDQYLEGFNKFLKKIFMTSKRLIICFSRYFGVPCNHANVLYTHFLIYSFKILFNIIL